MYKLFLQVKLLNREFRISPDVLGFDIVLPHLLPYS